MDLDTDSDAVCLHWVDDMIMGIFLPFVISTASCYFHVVQSLLLFWSSIIFALSVGCILPFWLVLI